MKRRTQNILYHLLPVVFWLLAAGGSAFFYRTWPGYVTAVIALACVVIIGHIKRHSSSVEQCFIVALLLGVTAYLLPSIVFLILPIWGYLIYQNIFSLRSFLASLIGLATIGIWLGILNQFQITNFQFQVACNLSAWIPTGAVLFAYLASTIVRQNLRER